MSAVNPIRLEVPGLNAGERLDKVHGKALSHVVAADWHSP